MDAASRVRDGFNRQQFMAALGATLERVGDGEAEVRLRCQPGHLQHTGVVHAGVVTAIVDTACGSAAASLMAEGREVVSVEFKLNLLAPATGDYLSAVGRVVRAGRTLTVCTGEVRAVTAGSSQLVAVMQATMMAVSPSSKVTEAD